jgi:hypothetical protein
MMLLKSTRYFNARVSAPFCIPFVVILYSSRDNKQLRLAYSVAFHRRAQQRGGRRRRTRTKITKKTRRRRNENYIGEGGGGGGEGKTGKGSGARRADGGL